MKINTNKSTLYDDMPGIGRIGISAASYGITNLKLWQPDNNQPTFSFMEQNQCNLKPVTPVHKIHYEISQQIHQYLAGKRQYFDVPIAVLISGDQKEILDVVRQIPYAQMITYDQLADRLNDSKLKTKISSVLHKNPLPLIIPCHRVIKSNNDIGGYIWGRKIKRWLLWLESMCHNNLK